MMSQQQMVEDAHKKAFSVASRLNNIEYLQNQIHKITEEAAATNTQPCYKSLCLNILQQQQLEEYQWFSLLFSLASMPSINLCTAK